MTYKTIHNHIYDKLFCLMPNIEMLKTDTSQISKGEGFMDLYLNVLNEEGGGGGELGRIKIISLSHYYKQNGDLVPDPDMTIKIYLQRKTAEALTYQDSFKLDVVYPTPITMSINSKKELNLFLNRWLSNCIQQGHKFTS